MSTKEEIQELLPFYVNGSLSAEEKTLVESYLKEDPSLQSEVDFIKALGSAIKDIPQEQSPGEFGLKRLQRDIKKEKAQTSATVKTVSKPISLWRNMAIAAGLALILQTAYMVNDKTGGGKLIPAGGENTISISGPVLTVTFVPTATEESIRNLLVEHDLRIIDGPSALGIYRLTTDGDITKAINALKNNKDKVESVQKEAK